MYRPVAQLANLSILPISPAGPRSLFKFFLLLALRDSRFRAHSRFSLGIDMNRGRRTDRETSPVLRGIFEYDVDYFSGRSSQPQWFTRFELQYQHGEVPTARVGNIRIDETDDGLNWARGRAFARRRRCCGPKLLSGRDEVEIPDIRVIAVRSCTASIAHAGSSSMGRTSRSAS